MTSAPGLAAVVAAGAAALIAGCGSGSGSAARTTTMGAAPAGTVATGRTTTGAAPAPPPSCGARGFGAGTARHTLVSDGVGRSFRLELPPGYDGHHRLPLVLAFHGYQGSADDFERSTGLEREGARRAVIVATPDGVARQWNFVRRGAVGPDDVAFSARLVRLLEHDACADSARVYATGISDGGDMADTLACALPATFAAVAPVAASVSPVPCAPGSSVLEIHGTGDPIVPYEGGGGDRPPPFDGTEAQPVSRRMARWAALNRCAAVPGRAAVASGVVRSLWRCPAGVAVELLTIVGGGHTWPGGVPDPTLGATSTAISANRAILRFFAAHRR
ncbi:MAG TPA: PHB depolymerase family esterase [Solirubrobacteraceae bacterium]